jgi:hypothetical protein
LYKLKLSIFIKIDIIIYKEYKSNIIKMEHIHQYGQYFTTNNILKEKVFEFILNNPINILEPSIGQGDLVTYVLSKKSNIIFDMYEIDNKIKVLSPIKKENIIYDDFMNQKINKLYKTIIGNPPAFSFQEKFFFEKSKSSICYYL